MRDTETHPGTPDDSDRDSTTVSYSLDEDNLREIDDDPAVFREDVEVGGCVCVPVYVCMSAGVCMWGDIHVHRQLDVLLCSKILYVVLR